MVISEEEGYGKMKKCFRLITLCLGLTLAASAAVCADDSLKASEYLNEYYNIAPFSDPTLDNVNAALTALGGEKLTNANEGELLAAGLRIAGLEELALTYVNDDAPDKAAKVLSDAGIDPASVPEEYLPYYACVFDLDLIPTDAPTEIEDYLYRCAEIGGKGRHYIGRISDENLMSILESTLNSYVIFDQEELTAVGTEIVLQGATTGYNLKYSGYDANFLADYTIKYGHSDYQHAVQLIGLLRSEGMDGYIQIEPKVSVYEYMIDWGDPGEPTPTYAVIQVTDDRYLCFAIEYDMMIEFDTLEEKERFHSVIETYAKKYDDSFDADGNLTEKLLAGAWWQPLYSSTTEMQNDEFGLLIDNVIYDENGEYSIHSFSTPEKVTAVRQVVAKKAPKLKVSAQKIYVNPAFIRYITNSDYQ